MKKLLFSAFIILLLFNLTFSKSDKIKITSDYIKTNFLELSKKPTLIQSFNKIFKSGQIPLLKEFISLLDKNKINFISEYETFYQKKIKTLERIYNKLKYKDETNIKRLSPAFEWAETERVVIFHIKHSALLSSLSCPFVDDEKFVIRNNKQDIHYEAKCILDNNYLFFNLDLRLYKYVDKIEKKEAQRGETYYVIEKKDKEEWDGRLLEGGYKLPDNSLKMF